MHPDPKQILVEILRQEIPQVESIYLFGSRAVGSGTSESDWDIAFLTPHTFQISADELFSLKTKLESVLKADIDLIHLNRASTVFQFQIISTGVHLFVRNESDTLKHEALIFSLYQRLNEERKYILEEILSSGKVYSK